ncbi:MAG: chemotaxis protein CheW [Deltaproteobacteria bacterium]|nr:chemotaxis protein CheW [Deltaproteobacteria bacterium]
MEQLCTFYLDSYFLAVDALRVQEVLRQQPLTQVPLAPPAIKGLMNLRGQIVPVVDLRHRFGFAPLPPGKKSFNVLLRGQDGLVSFLVDRVADVIEVPSEDFEPIPETLQGEGRRLLRGAFKLEKRLLLVLDAVRAMDASEL